MEVGCASEQCPAFALDHQLAAVVLAGYLSIHATLVINIYSLIPGIRFICPQEVVSADEQRGSLEASIDEPRELLIKHLVLRIDRLGSYGGLGQLIPPTVKSIPLKFLDHFHLTDSFGRVDIDVLQL